MMPESIAEQVGWKETFKSKTAGFVEKMRDSKEMLFNIALYGGLGFVLGYLAKKLSSYLIMIAILIVITIALYQFEVLYISINWTKVQLFLGMQPVAPGQDVSIFGALWVWMKANVVISVSFIIGFLLGLKFGA